LRHVRQSPSSSGVEGWLLFLCFVLVIFFPIGVLLELRAVWLRMLAMPEVQFGVMLVIAVDTAMLGLAIAAGLLLYRVRPIGVRLAQLFFALRLMIAIVAAVENRTAESALAIIVSLAWLIYLFTSERVRLTYPSKSARISETFR
jgi:hypothetical protein